MSSVFTHSPARSRRRRGFVEMARDDVEDVMQRWDALKRQGHPPVEATFECTVQEMFDRLVGSQIMLLRAIEEIEARPWWRRRRYNPYAR